MDIRKTIADRINEKHVVSQDRLIQGILRVMVEKLVVHVIDDLENLVEEGNAGGWTVTSFLNDDFDACEGCAEFRSSESLVLVDDDGVRLCEGCLEEAKEAEKLGEVIK